MRSLAFAVALATSLVSASVIPSNPLHLAALLGGKTYFGSASDNAVEFNDTVYTGILSKVATFGQVTPANAMKWALTEPTRNNFTLDSADQLVTFAEANGQIVRGHNFVWHNQLPDWLTSVNWTASELTSILENHISTLGSRYRGRIFAWDVVNEGMNEDGTFRETLWLDTLGEGYFAQAFKLASLADPSARLYLNDFNIEGVNNKSDAYFNLVQSLQAQNVPIHGIGLQAHFIVGGVPDTLQKNMQRFGDLGIEVAITELDLRMDLPPTPELLAQQEQDYFTVIQACEAVDACVGVTIWDYTDKYSWIPGVFTNQGSACAWDEMLAPKPGIISAIEKGFLGKTL